MSTDPNQSGEEQPKKAQEPLPEVPKGPLTVSQARAARPKP